jgi:Uma2 family endonuclease
MTYEEFLSDQSEEHAEWVDGEVIPMMAVSQAHQAVSGFLLHLMQSLVDFYRLGRVFYEPFNMKLAGNLPGRSPDICFVATEHLDRVRTNRLEGPADIAVEVVSPGSGETDRGKKYFEYEAGGVTEYWLIDPHRQVAEFYRLNARGVYEPVPTPDGVFRSAVLQGFWLRVAWLWERPTLREAEAELGLR